MSTHMEGNKMPTSIAEARARQKAVFAKYEHPEGSSAPTANDSHIEEATRLLSTKPSATLEEMFGEKRAAGLRLGAKTRDEILHKKLPDF